MEQDKRSLPPERKPQGRRHAKSNRRMLDAVLYWLNTGIPWRALSQRHGSWQTVYSRFRTWTQADVWEQVLHALIAQDLVDGTALMPDSTTEKYTGMAVGLKRGL